jgi:hypothetical protein
MQVSPGTAVGSRPHATVAGPTYDEMFRPELLPTSVRSRAAAAHSNEFDPANLFNITWRGQKAVFGTLSCHANSPAWTQTFLS